MNSLLKIKNLKKSYSQNTVLKNINLDINEGDIIAVTGGNGSGKSTLLKLIAGVNVPTEGQVLNLVPNLKLGFVPDKFPEDTRFNIYEYMNFLGSINGLSKKSTKNKIDSTLENFHLKEYAYKRIDTFSKGMMQKINIMQGTLNEPDILVLDEPISGLDYHAQIEIKNIIKSLHENGVSIILTSHEKELIEEISTRIININNGLILSEKESFDKDIHWVKIVFFMKASLLREELISRIQVKKVEIENEICTVIVEKEQTNATLREILSNEGSVFEVIRL